MESLKALANEQAIDPATGEAPLRFGVLFAGNGFHHKWWAKGTGAEMELGRVLEPLQAHREKLLFLSGLYNEEALKGISTARKQETCYPSAPLASGGDINSGTSIDQVLAQTYGQGTKVPSLVLGCEKSNPSVHKNYSMLYSSHIFLELTNHSYTTRIVSRSRL
ncbi:MAG: DUF1552 domain-containing protein [Planctomycetaceae bacterium]